MKLKTQEKWWIGVFITLWMLVSTVSTIHSVEFFKLSNSTTLAWILALGFELGAIASLGGLIISRGGKGLIWFLFILLTAFQIHGNMYWAWVNAGDLTEWIHLLDLIDNDPDVQKRIFAIISGGILPLVALGFMKSLMDYLNPNKLEPEHVEEVQDEHLDKEVEEILDEAETVKGDEAIESIQNIEKAAPMNLENDYIKAVDEDLDKKVEVLSEDEKEKLEELTAENVYSSKELLEELDEEVEEKPEFLPTDPFWANMNPEQTAKFLNKSNEKLKKNNSSQK